MRATVDVLDGGRTHRVALLRDEAPVAYREVASSWRDDAAFRAHFISLLAEAPFEAFFWETPCVTRSSLDRPFEFVLVDSPALAGVDPDDRAFRDHFDQAPSGGGACCFQNLGRDAHLVAPLPAGPKSSYAHLAAFSRLAPLEQQHAFWIEVGRALELRLGNAPTWVSTSGLGVYWLHVRLDAQPKYYTYSLYREPS